VTLSNLNFSRNIRPKGKQNHLRLITECEQWVLEARYARGTLRPAPSLLGVPPQPALLLGSARLSLKMSPGSDVRTPPRNTEDNTQYGEHDLSFTYFETSLYPKSWLCPCRPRARAPNPNSHESIKCAPQFE
jgi:hypothetical protein